MSSQLTQFLLGKPARAMFKREENSVKRMAAIRESFLCPLHSSLESEVIHSLEHEKRKEGKQENHVEKQLFMFLF